MRNMPISQRKVPGALGVIAGCLMLIFLGAISCSQRELTPTGSDPVQPHGSIVEVAGCKGFSIVPPDSGVPADLDCIFYSFISGTLTLTHVNAGFNCCPDTIYSNMDIADGIISIHEIEAGSTWCDCLCLYDIDYVLEDLAPGDYLIRFHEPYVGDEETPLEFSAVLEESLQGQYCVERTHYPWGSVVPPEPNGTFLGDSGCKQDVPRNSAVWPSDQECLMYSYESDSMLQLTHINAYFNCCPGAIHGKVTMRPDTILVEEWQERNGCRCMCLYDLDYEVRHLAPGAYCIRILYLSNGNPFECLNITVDLELPVSGVYCEDRC